jgi:hypothetical protein
MSDQPEGLAAAVHPLQLAKLTPQSAVDTTHHFLSTQPEISEEQNNRIKVLYDGVVRLLRKAPDSRLRPGVGAVVRHLSS